MNNRRMQHIGSTLLNVNDSVIHHRVLIALGVLLSLSNGIGRSGYAAVLTPPTRTNRGPTAGNPDEPLPFTVTYLDAAQQSVGIRENLSGNESTLKIHQKTGPWTLMAVLNKDGDRMAVFENLAERTGSIVYARPGAVLLVLAKSLEATSVPEETLYHGRTLEAVVESPKDVLAEEILAESADPTFRQVAASLPPLRIPTFVGTRHSLEKVVFEYGGATINYIDSSDLIPEIKQVRERRGVWEGLVGNWLPVVRFLFPTGENSYWEEVIFADEDPSKFWTQPVWYRLIHVVDGKIKASHYFYHHLPYPPRDEPAAHQFFQALLNVHRASNEVLAPAMTIDIPDPVHYDFCRHALLLEIITRTGDHPRYGYPPIHQKTMVEGILGSGFSNVDSFQDTFNSSVSTFLEWGMTGRAGRYIDDYFSKFVRDDGSIDTRGPEIGQYGRMLTSVSRYYDLTGDEKLVLNHHGKISAIADLLLSLVKESRQFPRSDIGYGVIRGWSEHDSGLQSDPYRFILPHFSNSAEVCRGFHDLGQSWTEIGRKTSNSNLITAGERLTQEAAGLKADLHDAIRRSIDWTQAPPYLPAVAGDIKPLWRNRVYSEMLHSGVLTGEMVRIITRYQSSNGQRVLGLPRNGKAVNGFVVYGYAYGLIHNDMIREFLLFYYAHRAHVYSRGTWTAVEVAGIDGTPLSTYCTPAQLTIPALTKWMLVFEDPDEPIIWLARATPRAWLEEGQRIAVTGAPTRFGRIDFELKSELSQGKITGFIQRPEDAKEAVIKIRMRLPGGRKISNARVNGEVWEAFDPGEETVTLPASLRGKIHLEINCEDGAKAGIARRFPEFLIINQ